MFYLNPIDIKPILFALPLLTFIQLRWIMFILIIFSLLFAINLISKPPSYDGYTNSNWKVHSVLSNGFIVVKNKYRLFVFSKNNYYPGDVIYLKGKVIEITGEYKNYYNAQNVYQEVFFPQKIRLVSSSSDFRNSLYKYIDRGPNLYRSYTNLLVLGRKTLPSNLYKDIIKLNIAHLFVISGFHLGLLFLVIKKLFMFAFPKDVSIWIAIGLLLIYLYMLRFPISASRSFLFILLLSTNKFIKTHFSKIQILNFTMIIVMLIRPISILSSSFILTFLATYTIVFINEINFKKKIHKLLFIYIGVYLVILPYTMWLNRYISLFGIFYSVIFTPLMPVFYIGLMISLPFYSLGDAIANTLNQIITLAQHTSLIVSVSVFNANFCKNTYLTIEYLFIIYLWLNYFMVKRTS